MPPIAFVGTGNRLVYLGQRAAYLQKILGFSCEKQKGELEKVHDPLLPKEGLWDIWDFFPSRAQKDIRA